MLFPSVLWGIHFFFFSFFLFYLFIFFEFFPKLIVSLMIILVGVTFMLINLFLVEDNETYFFNCRFLTKEKSI